MTEQLHERLADLAGDVATPAPLDPAGLWHTGKRRQRRRTAAAAVAACAVVLAGVSGAGLLLPSGDLSQAPSATKTAPALPDRLHVPGHGLISNEDDSAGPFAVLLSAGQGWPVKTSLVGVSATTGEYRRVTLPGGLPPELGFSETAASLSPSGRYVAYWLQRPGDRADDHGGMEALSGVAVYDTRTGKVRRELVDAPYGISAWALLWVDDSRLYFRAGEIGGAPGTDRASSSRAIGRGWVWDVDGAQRRVPLAMPGGEAIDDVVASDGHGRLLVDPRGGSRYLLLDPAHPKEAQQVRVRRSDSNGTSSAVAASRDGKTAVAAGDDHGSFLAVTFPDGRARNFRDLRAFDVYGWADATHVVVGLGAPSEDGVGSTRIAEVDVTTGRSAPFIRMPSQQLNSPELASDLLGTPPVDRGEPDWPTDPRVFIGLGVGAVVLLLGALGVWRRREQR